MYKPHRLPAKTRAVSIDDETAEVLIRLGGGNMSRGVRLAARIADGRGQEVDRVRRGPVSPADLRASDEAAAEAGAPWDAPAGPLDVPSAQ